MNPDRIYTLESKDRSNIKGATFTHFLWLFLTLKFHRFELACLHAMHGGSVIQSFKRFKEVLQSFKEVLHALTGAKLAPFIEVLSLGVVPEEVRLASFYCGSISQ